MPLRLPIQDVQLQEGNPPMRRIICLTAVAFAALATPALAHHGNVVLSCTSATYTFAAFHVPSVVSYEISSDNVGIASGTFQVKPPGGTFTVPLDIHGNHLLVATAAWTTEGGGKVVGSKNVVCAPVTPAPVPVTPAPAPTPPAVAPTPVATPSVPATAPRIPVRTRRFSRTPTKRCVHGRRHLVDSKGRHFTMCKRAPGRKTPATPNFTG